MNNYTVTDVASPAGFSIIRLNDDFDGVEFYFTEVKFEVDEPILHFSYNVVSGKVPDDKTKEFQDLLSKILVSILEQQVESNEIVYAGGVDE